LLFGIWVKCDFSPVRSSSIYRVVSFIVFEGDAVDVDDDGCCSMVCVVNAKWDGAAVQYVLEEWARHAEYVEHVEGWSRWSEVFPCGVV